MFGDSALLLLLLCQAGGGNGMSDSNTEGFLWMGGCGGAYFLVQPGELELVVAKRDRNRRGRHTELRALLVGPDREVLQERAIPDDGIVKGESMGPVQTVTLKARVESPGIYGLNVTVSQDRYGEEMVWGFRSSCERFVIETARGHKDERHQEPIVLESFDQAGEIWFLPWQNEMVLQGQSLLPEGGDVLLVNSQGEEIDRLEVGEDGSFRGEVPASVSREHFPWGLRLPSMKGTLHVDGLTRWERGQPFENMCLWSPTKDAFFPYQQCRWLLTPYRRVVYSELGGSQEISFRVHNNDTRVREVQLSIEGVEEQVVETALSKKTLKLDSGETREIRLHLRRSKKKKGKKLVRFRVRAVVDGLEEISSFSSVEVRTGLPPVKEALDLPFHLKPYTHENAQRGYLPEYPLDNQVYFDLDNTPAVLGVEEIHARRKGVWDSCEIPQLREGWRSASSKVAFGGKGDLYLLARKEGQLGLLYTRGWGRPFQGCLLPTGGSGSQSGDLEQFSGHNTPDGPPPVVRFTQRARDPNRIWRRIQDLDLFLPILTDQGLDEGDGIRLSDKCIGLSAHSGIPSSIVSLGGKVHVVWAEATDPEEKVPGVPTFVATVNRETGTASEPALVGYGPPPNDIHNTPSITMDSRGFLHVLIGTHGRPFQYVRSLEPNTANKGWTEPRVLGENLRQTYVGFVCDPEDTLHVVFRLWKNGCDPFQHSSFATLAAMRKEKDGDWEGPEILLLPPFSEYSIFYHRLTIDRVGRLFLSYDYWSTYWFYRNDHFGSRRSLMMSQDQGKSWKLVEKELNRRR